MDTGGAVTILPVRGLPEVAPGDDLAALIAAAVALRDGDVVVVAQKVVSKSEGALVRVPHGEDRAAARARLVREQAVRVLVEAPWTVIVETSQGLVCAAAGIDASNVEPGVLALLPQDPDASAARLRAGLLARTGAAVAVLVTDTFGRPWRVGQTDVAIGAAGLPVIRDERGGRDRFGMTLEVTEVALADEVAAAADLVRRKAEGVPVVVVRGLGYDPDEQARARDLQRPSSSDLFPRGRGALADLLAAGPPGPAEPAPPAEDGHRPAPLAPPAQDGHRPAPLAGPTTGGVAGPGAGRPGAADWARAAAAARGMGGRRVAVDLDRAGAPGRDHARRPPGTSAVLAVEGDAAADLVALGAATAALVVALADLGWTGAWHAEGDRRTRVVASPPAG